MPKAVLEFFRISIDSGMGANVLPNYSVPKNYSFNTEISVLL